MTKQTITAAVFNHSVTEVSLNVAQRINSSRMVCDESKITNSRSEGIKNGYCMTTICNARTGITNASVSFFLKPERTHAAPNSSAISRTQQRVKYRDRSKYATFEENHQ